MTIIFRQMLAERAQKRAGMCVLSKERREAGALIRFQLLCKKCVPIYQNAHHQH